MPYPVVSRAEARRFLIASFDGQSQSLPPVRTMNDGAEEDWEDIAELLFAKLFELTQKNDGQDKTIGGSAFEIAAAPVIHQILPRHLALADPEFWTWLVIYYGKPLVEWRYGESKNLKNFGVGGSTENFIFRLWLRAEIASDPAKPNDYSLAAIGDIDFWRSHIFRQRFTDATNFLRAWLNFQFPPEKAGKPRLKILEIRQLVSHIKRARTNLMFEIMTEERASEFIETEWAKLAASSE